MKCAFAVARSSKPAVHPDGPADHHAGYWRYADAFIGSRWIWTISLVFDNTVLPRKTVR